MEAGWVLRQKLSVSEDSFHDVLIVQQNYDLGGSIFVDVSRLVEELKLLGRLGEKMDNQGDPVPLTHIV